jgi:hypothetical protein
MVSITKKPGIILGKVMRARPAYAGFILAILGMVLLAACDAGLIQYKGTCSQQTQQFMDYVHSMAVDELNPLIADGFKTGPTADVMKRIDDLNTKISEINTPECNTKTQIVKDAFLLYMVETRNYFTVVMGRAVYGDGSVQAQFAKMSDAALAFEIALEDLRK